MDAGTCLRCGRPFTSGEVTGTGILRPRQAAMGGPFVEFACPGCKRIHRLVPHGGGRYAPPGTPPPPTPSEADRRVPWRREQPSGAAAASASSGATAVGRAARDEMPADRPHVERETPARRSQTEDAAADDREDESPLPVDVREALATLGLSIDASAKEIESAFRRLALTCHPDKVAHLDAEFVALAERKFKRLQSARDLLLGA